jgi:hypothetical protein
MQDQAINPGAGLIDQLLDIHKVTEPTFWPPAPGWWMLGALLLVLLLVALVKLIRKMRVRIRRRRLLGELDGLAETFDPRTRPADYLAALNRLFRGVALRAFPGSGCGRLEGEAWVAFIRGRLDEAGDLSGLEALETGPYQERPEFEPGQLQDLARQWVLSYG